jgi:L,D-transpeptidase ErfK/SrfK
MALLWFVFALQLAGGSSEYVVRPGDSLTLIGARLGVDARVIAASNALKPNAVLKPDMKLRIDNRHIVPSADGVNIVVNIPQRMLFYFVDGRLAEAHPIAAGSRGWRTPRGNFEIVLAEENPVWNVPSSIQAEMARMGKKVLTHVPPGPSNPLGRYWLGLSLPGIGIHGTNAPASIYSLQTHGCLRLHPDDIEPLFSAVQVGTTGRIIYEPVLVALMGESIFIEVHPDGYGLKPDAARTIWEFAEAMRLLDAVDWSLIDEVIRKKDGIARDVRRIVATGPR